MLTVDCPRASMDLDVSGRGLSILTYFVRLARIAVWQAILGREERADRGSCLGLLALPCSSRHFGRWDGHGMLVKSSTAMLAMVVHGPSSCGTCLSKAKANPPRTPKPPRNDARHLAESMDPAEQLAI